MKTFTFRRLKLSGMKFDHRIAYIAAALIVTLGYLFVFRGYEDAIGTEQTSADAARVATERNLDRIRRRTVLETQHQRLVHELSGIDVHSDRTTIVARFVVDMAAIASRERVHLISLEADRSSAANGSVNAAPPSPLPAKTAQPAVGAATAPHATSVMGNGAAPPVGLEPIPLLLTLQGDYAHILGSVLGLARGHVLAQVDVQSLERLRGARRGQSPELTAKIHVTLFRQIASSSTVVQGVSDARTRSL